MTWNGQRPVQLTSTAAVDEINPALDWPWVVCQTRATGNTNAPWLLLATNLASGRNFVVSPSTQYELNPDVQAGRVVWQDFRDQGPGEIYYCDLQTQAVRRITTNIYGQYNPAIDGNWIVWADNRNVELDIYGFDLVRNAEIRITSTADNESQPALDGPWLVCMSDGLGPQTGNARLIHLPSLLAVPLTSTPTLKTYAGLADGLAVWQETISNQSQIISAVLPVLQPVFQNRNVVAVTPAMVSGAQNAYGLLALWGGSGVQSITEYTSLAGGGQPDRVVEQRGAERAGFRVGGGQLSLGQVQQRAGARPGRQQQWIDQPGGGGQRLRLHGLSRRLQRLHPLAADRPEQRPCPCACSMRNRGAGGWPRCRAAEWRATIFRSRTPPC